MTEVLFLSTNSVVFTISGNIIDRKCNNIQNAILSMEMEQSDMGIDKPYNYVAIIEMYGSRIKMCNVLCHCLFHIVLNITFLKINCFGPILQ